jgi:hypothetical protein
MPINIYSAKTMYISSTVTSSHIRILERNVRGLMLFDISCWAYLLVSSTMSCTRAISNMFSNTLTTSSSVLLNYGPYTLRNVSREVGNESILSHTKLLDTPPNPTCTISTCLTSVPLSRHVDGPDMVNCDRWEVTQLYLEADSWENFTDNANKDHIPFTSHHCKLHLAGAMGSINMALRN